MRAWYQALGSAFVDLMSTLGQVLAFDLCVRSEYAKWLLWRAAIDSRQRGELVEELRRYAAAQGRPQDGPEQKKFPNKSIFWAKVVPTELILIPVGIRKGPKILFFDLKNCFLCQKSFI